MTAPTQHPADFVVEVPATSKYLTAVPQKVLPSLSGTLQASGDGSNATRISVLERKQAELVLKQARLEKRVSDIELVLKKLVV